MGIESPGVQELLPAGRRAGVPQRGTRISIERKTRGRANVDAGNMWGLAAIEAASKMDNLVTMGGTTVAWQGSARIRISSENKDLANFGREDGEAGTGGLPNPAPAPSEVILWDEADGGPGCAPGIGAASATAKAGGASSCADAPEDA